MILNSPYITGSITVTGNANIQGQLTVTGSLSGTATSASYAYTASSAINAFSASRAISSSYSATASFSNDFTVLGNLTVFGTQSVQYITSSQLNISDNVITVNVASPGVRFGGLSVFDSGSLSSEATASLFWDSQNNHWVYQRESGSTYTGGMLISGPRNTGGLGNELGTTACMLLVGQGGDHLTSSMVYHSTTCTNFYSNALFVSSSCNVGIGTNSPCHLLHVNSSSPSILLQSTSSTGPAYLRFNNTTRSNTNYIALGGTSNDLFFTVNGADRFFISGSGNIGIGTQTPNRLLSIQGPAESWIESITTQPTTQCWIFGQDGARKGFEVYDLNQTATRLFVAPTTGNIGVSNVCPRSPLSFSNGTGDKIDFYNDNIARYSVQVNAGELRFFTCGTDRISLYAGNTVGLVNRSGKIAIAATSTDALFSIGDWCNRNGRLLTTNCAGWAADGVTPCMVISSNTTSTCKAQVIGLALHNDSQTANTYTPALVFSRRSYSGAYNSAIAIIQAQATVCAQDTNWVAGDLIFSTNPPGGYMSESMRIQGTGDITFGECCNNSTRNVYWVQSVGELQLNGGNGSNSIGAAGATLRFGNNTGGARRFWSLQLDGSNQFGTWYYNESVGWTKVGYQTTGGTWTNSDERRKENIVDFNYGLKEVLELRPKMFNYKNDERKIKNLGFIAQQVLPSIPEAVQSDEDDGKQYYAMNYGNLTTVLVKAIQEQQCTINTLKTCLGIS